MEYIAANYGASFASPGQYDVLFYTIDTLVAAHPDRLITFYIHDLDIDDIEYAINKAKWHCLTRSYSNVVFRPLEGNIVSIYPPRSDSAHIKNPGQSLLKKLAAGQNNLLSRLAARSRTGIELHTYMLSLFDTAMLMDPGLEKPVELGTGPAYKILEGTLKGAEHAQRPVQVFGLYPKKEPCVTIARQASLELSKTISQSANK